MARKTGGDFLYAVLALAIAVLVLAPVNALITTWGATTLWDWFVAPQYGAGPKAMTWYGFALLLTLILLGPLARIPRKEEDAEGGEMVLSAIKSAIAHAFAVVAMVGAGWVIKAIAWS